MLDNLINVEISGDYEFGHESRITINLNNVNYVKAQWSPGREEYIYYVSMVDGSCFMVTKDTYDYLKSLCSYISKP